MRLEEMFGFAPRKKTPDEQRRRNKPRDTLGNRPDSRRDGPNVNFTNSGVAREYKDLVSPKPKSKMRDPDRLTARERLRKVYGVGSGPVGKLPENHEDAKMELKKLFELAGVDMTAGKAKELVEGDDVVIVPPQQ